MKNSFKYAFRGFQSALRSERNMRVHLFMAIMAIFLGFFLHISSAEWCTVVLVITLVTGAEMLNTALEYLLDHLHPERHETVGKIKDISAGMVLVVAIGAAVSGCIIFIPKIMEVLN